MTQSVKPTAKKAVAKKETVILPTEEVEEVQQDTVLAFMKQMQNRLEVLEKENRDLKEKTSQQNTVTYVNQVQSRYIEVVSLFHGKMTLTTGERDSGKRYDFKDFGFKHKILSEELRSIVSKYDRFAREGYFYIEDAQFVEDNGLREEYKNILPKSRLEDLISGKHDDEIVAIFKSSTDQQKALIIELFAERISNNLQYSPSVVAKLQRVANAYVKKINSDAIGSGAEIPDWSLVDIIDKAKLSSQYDKYGNYKKDDSDMDYDDE